MVEIDRLAERLAVTLPIINNLSVGEIKDLPYLDEVRELAKRFANFAKPSGEIDLLDGGSAMIVGMVDRQGFGFIGVGDYIDNRSKENPKLVAVGRRAGSEKVQTQTFLMVDVVSWKLIQLAG